MKRVQNGKIALEDRKFMWDADIKNEFLATLLSSTAKTTKGILLKVDEYENKLKKSVFDLSFEEIDVLLETKFQNKSINVVRSNLSYIRKYVKYCIDKNYVLHMENRFLTITNVEKYVNVNAMQMKYISKDELREIQKLIVNNCDKLIPELLFLSARGRTQKNNSYEELCNLEVTDIDFNNNSIVLRNNDGDERIVTGLEEYTMKLLKDTINQRLYVINNGKSVDRKHKAEEMGKGMGTRAYPINETEYVFRIAGKNKYGKVRPNFFAERLRVLRDWVENPFLTPTSIYLSGLVHFAYKVYLERGKLEKEDLIYILEAFNYGEPKLNPKTGIKEWISEVWKLKELVENGFKALGLRYEM